jgi:aminoglycoside phosphotransferase family enzyme/predicted kinase
MSSIHLPNTPDGAARAATTALIEALTRPGALPGSLSGGSGGGASIDVVETHASIVFLVGDSAFKLKKAVDLGFLDFTSVERRYADCLDELRLNRRLAPEFYRGMWPVVREHRLPGHGSRALVVRRIEPLGHGCDETLDGEIVDWVIEMVRLPSDGMLDRLLARGPGGPPSEAEVRRLAEEIALFHEKAATGEGIDCFGEVALVRNRVADNLDRLERAAVVEPLLAQRSTFARLRTATLAWLEALGPTLDERRRAGRVREGHGDLHARNICRVPTADGARLVAYDCLEFSLAYRSADVAAEVAFLAMDFECRGRRDLSEAWKDAYVQASKDATLEKPFRFFRLHYAIVRSLIDVIRLRERAPDGHDPALADEALRYLALALGSCVEPALVVLCGLPATGKSTCAAALAVPLRADIIRTDLVRKELFGVEPTARGPRSMYDAAASAATYDEARRRAGDALASGRSVVLDGAHLSADERGRSIALAERFGVPWVLVETSADHAVIRARLARRSARPDNVSDATEEVVERLRRSHEIPREIDQARRIEIETGDDGSSEAASSSPGRLTAPATMVAIIDRLLAFDRRAPRS